MKSKCIMIQGTGSSVGKSLITAALCRVFKQDGYKVAPFKSQNMALNSFITLEGEEMGRAQVVQAEAAGIEPSALMNPILLKPTADKTAQVIIKGKVYRNMTAMEYHDFKPQLAYMIKETYGILDKKNDIIVIEGAGSPAEINLRENDVVNMGMAELVDAPVVLVGDIDKGGVFAQLAGTMLLLTEEEKTRVKGVIINKFRGDIEILKPGLKMLENIIKIPVLGVLPYVKTYIDEEDCISERFSDTPTEDIDKIDVVVIHLPHISNSTDFNAFEHIQGVRLRYVGRASDIKSPELIILPGSKNTIEDLLYIRSAGIEDEIKKLHEKGTVIFGVCGGYQMLGKHIKDPFFTESGIDSIEGMGLLNTWTTFGQSKVTTQVEALVIDNTGLMKDLKGLTIKGYEIHMGITEYGEGCSPFIELNKVFGKIKPSIDGVRNQNGNVFGTYIHGLFDNMEFTTGLINNLREKKGLKIVSENNTRLKDFKEAEYDKLADLLRGNLDMDKIYEIVGAKSKTILFSQIGSEK